MEAKMFKEKYIDAIRDFPFLLYIYVSRSPMSSGGVRGRGGRFITMGLGEGAASW